MFTRTLAASSRIRASTFRTATLARTTLAQRGMSSKPPRNTGEPKRGAEEIVPFLKRRYATTYWLTIGIPVDVYPLVAAVSFVCCLGVFFGVRTLATDKNLRLKPTGTF